MRGEGRGVRGGRVGARGEAVVCGQGQRSGQGKVRAASTCRTLTLTLTLTLTPTLHLQDRRVAHDLVERGGVLGVGPPLVPPLRLEVVRVRIRGWD